MNAPQWRLRTLLGDRINTALSMLKKGFHCSQCVFEAFGPDFGLPRELARRLSASLAGGSIPGGECGAISSGYLVIGLRFGSVDAVRFKGPEFEKMKLMYSRIHQS